MMFLTISACFTEVNVQKFLQMLLLATKYFHSGKEMSVKSMYFKNFKILIILIMCAGRVHNKLVYSSCKFLRIYLTTNTLKWGNGAILN